MDPLKYYYLIAIGIALIGVEALLFSFVFFFFGVGFVVVGIVALWYPFGSFFTQAATASVIALIFALLFRKRLLETFTKSQTTPEERVHTQGFGIIEDGMVKFDGSYWQSVDDLTPFQNGERVRVVDVVDNKVVIKKQSEV